VQLVKKGYILAKLPSVLVMDAGRPSYWCPVASHGRWAASSPRGRQRSCRR